MAGRFLPDVLPQIIALIPGDQMNDDLRNELNSIQTSALYASPEVMVDHWNAVAQSLNRHLHTPPAYLWEREIANIFAGQRVA